MLLSSTATNLGYVEKKFSIWRLPKDPATKWTVSKGVGEINENNFYKKGYSWKESYWKRKAL
jgi:hypothetical protein